MKALKIILFIIAVFILLVVILGFLGPKTYDVNRSTVIDAPRAMLYQEVAHLGGQDAWGPWKEQEPEMVTTIHGNDGEVGTYSHWEGPESSGEQKIVNLVENELVETELKFIRPMESEANGYFKLADAASGGTELTWGFSGENGFMNRAMSMVGMDMDKFVGPMFEKGLSNLKTLVEEKAKAQKESQAKMSSSNYSFGIQDRPAMSYILKREKVPFDQIANFYGQNLPAIATAVAASGAEMIGQPCGVFYAWDVENSTADMCAAIPVASADVQIEGYQTVTLPAGRAVKVAYYGPYAGSADAHYAMDDYIKANNLTQNGPVIEQYITDPTQEPDTSKWLTDIYYAVD